MLLDTIPFGMPAGTPISAAILVKPHPLVSCLNNALAAIDTVHGDGLLPKIPIGLLTLAHGEGVFEGAYENGKSLAIAIDPRGNTRDLTALHEIGHFVDYCGLGELRQFHSVDSQEMQSWRQRIRASHSFKELTRNKSYLSASYQVPGGSRVIIPLDQKYVEYTLKWQELFARSYAQYITLQSGNAILQTQLDFIRNRPIHGIYSMQWDDDDFFGIAHALDRVFRLRGWIV